MSQSADGLAPRTVFSDPVVDLAALCPICALAALNPTAALAALSPALRLYNPAINPAAAWLAFIAPATGVSVHIRSKASARTAALMLVRAGLELLMRV